MGDIRYYTKKIPVSVYDVEGIESWLTDQAAKGYYLGKFGWLGGYFIKRNPSKVAYRLEPLQEEEKEPDQEKRAYYSDYGWEYVTTVGKLFAVYGSSVEEVEELHTDPVAYNYLFEILAKKQKRNWLLNVASAGLIVGMTLFGFFGHNEPVYAFVKYSGGVNQIMICAMWIFTLWQLWVENKDMNRLREKLAQGIGLTHHKDYHFSEKKQKLVTGVYLVTILLLCTLPFRGYSKGWQKPIHRIVGTLPMLPLEVVEAGERLTYETGDTGDNWVVYSENVCLAADYEIWQEGEVVGKQWEDNSGTYSPAIITNYMELRVGFLAEPFYNDLLKREKRYNKGRVDENGVAPAYEALEVEGLDQVIRIVYPLKQQFFIRKGNQIVDMKYYGEKDATIYLENLVPILAAQ